MPDYVKRVEAKKLFGRADLTVQLNEDINILYGKNGSGKTTLLHILSNALQGDFQRFSHLLFDEIMVSTGQGKTIRISCVRRRGKKVLEVAVDGHRLTFPMQRELVSERMWVTYTQRLSRGFQPDLFAQTEEPRPEPLILPSYFPAFRAMIEAWFEERHPRSEKYYSPPFEGFNIPPQKANLYWQRTVNARRVFGEFVPYLNYPAPQDIERGLSIQLSKANAVIAGEGRTLLSNAFLRALTHVRSGSAPPSEKPEEDLRQISDLLGQLDRVGVGESDSATFYRNLSDVVAGLATRRLTDDVTRVILSVLRESMQNQLEVLQQSYKALDQYIFSVNEFLEGKQIELNKAGEPPPVRIRFNNGTTAGLQALSSGERQILSMLYAAARQSPKSGVVLIDEPEISLHIEWQRMLLRKMREQLGKRQLIVCTHSPEVGASFPDAVQEISLQECSSFTPAANELSLEGDEL